MSTPQTGPTQATRVGEPSDRGQTCPARAGPAPDVAWHRAAWRARLLSWLSLAYLTAEGAIAITAAVLASGWRSPP